MSIQPNPSGGGILTEYATKAYVDAKTINTLSAQTADYDCQGYKLTNIAAPTSNTDAASKQYVDDISAIAEGIANTTVVTSGLTANQTEITNGTTPLNMNS